MFNKTNNPYSFKYLITGIVGEGIKEVYLPPVPDKSEILFTKEKKFIRQEMPANLKRAAKERAYYHAISEEDRKEQLKKDINYKHTDYVHPLQDQIQKWEDQEWKRSTEGVFFSSNGVITYITDFYYWYLTSWQTYFGFPTYRETDKELTYFIRYVEEDPDAYGALLNTIRRYGKSSILGALIVWRTIRNYNHNTGMQGEKESKVSKFYNKMVLKPFLKLPYYYLPTYDTSSTNKNEIKFDRRPSRGRVRDMQPFEEDDVLESMIDYRSSVSTEYDGDVLNTYVMEEPGKVTEASIYSEEGDGTWDVIKPCLRKGRQIRGKAFMGTTVELMNIADRGGKAYKELFYDSDFNQRKKDGRTASGLYACFLPGDTAYEDYLDEWGHPMRDLARESIMMERDSFKNKPSKLAGLIRKYPLSIVEIFYVNPSNCAFNSTILQDQIRFIDTSTINLTDKIDLYWENGVRFSRVLWRKNITGGWLEINWMPNIEDANKVKKMYGSGITNYQPLNDEKFAIGFDPIQHRTDGSNRESRPVAVVKRKYDTAIDGILDDDIMMQRAIDKYPYQTNKYVAMMDKRPSDPNVLFERLLMMCWFFGCSAHIEKQKDAVISYFHEKNCGDFVMAKYSHNYDGGNQTMTDGTAATPRLIEEYTSAYGHYIDNYGHTILFRAMVEDALMFNPSKTTEHDYTVAAGFCELACKMKPKVIKQPIRDISNYLPIFDRNNNVIG